MAPELRSSGEAAAPASYESVVDRQLGRACLRLRGLDAAASTLILLCLVIAYGLVMSLADRVSGVPLVVRLAAWCVLVVGLLVYLAVTANRLLLRRVNPFVLAHRPERAPPD